MKTIVTHHILGDITVSQTWRARRISIAVRPPDKVRLSIPYNVPLSDAMKFVEQKMEWIEKARLKLSDRYPICEIAMPYSTRSHSLWLNPFEGRSIRVKITNKEIIVNYPMELNYTEPTVQAAIKKGIDEAWRNEAQQVLPQMMERLAEQHKFTYHAVSIRNTVSKWGSCSTRNDISLSLHLMRLPDHLIEYILLHELCHTVHKNHGPRFHALLDKVTGARDKELHKELKAYTTRW